ncbi:MAG: hypothetical protein H6765_06195 [Candidatus Peribacteria bacterium]|nr:MAG: hypothetical protein H6765_06195 [Candidatus Peribacteria bacterium]
MIQQKRKKKSRPWIKWVLVFLVAGGLVYWGIEENEVWPFGVAGSLLLLTVVTSLMGPNAFKFAVNAGSYYFYSTIVHLFFVSIVLLGKIQVPIEYIGVVYVVVLGIELFFAAIIHPNSMVRKDWGQILSWAVILGAFGLWSLSTMGVLTVFEGLAEVKWQYFLIPLTMQLTDQWISAKLKPLSLRHFGDIDPND